MKVVCWVAATENMPSGTAIHPGDVLVARNGTSIEVLNTDAEGRLVLADALSLAAEEEPDAMIDVATLTGGQRVALGDGVAAVMSTDRALVARVIAAGKAAGEPAWELPLVSRVPAAARFRSGRLAERDCQAGCLGDHGRAVLEGVHRQPPVGSSGYRRSELGGRRRWLAHQRRHGMGHPDSHRAAPGLERLDAQLRTPD